MSDATDSAAKAYYDDFSTGYERERGRGYHQLIDDLEMRVLAPYVRGAKTLELGCGTGLILERVARVAKHAVGIDISPGMIAKAQERGLDASIGSVTDLPYDDASFDLVYSFKVLAHVPDIADAVAEAVRVTKPGGTLALEFYNPWSVRFLAKRIAGPQPISDGRTEADMFTRWDAPTDIARLVPKDAELLGFRGVRVVTPAAFVHRLPIVGNVVARAEHRLLDSPFARFGGFLVALLRRR
jgi:ubiquinone/menaquinone biosynthesis C-methylase UbiE